MTIGSWLDDRLSDAIVAAGRIANWALETSWPMNYLAMARPADPIGFNENEAGAYLLAAAEAERDVWEAGQFQTVPDDLWAAENAQPDEVAEPVGEYPDLPPSSHEADPRVSAVADVLAEHMAFLYLRGDWDFDAWAEHVAPQILRAADRSRSQ